MLNSGGSNQQFLPSKTLKGLSLQGVRPAALRGQEKPGSARQQPCVFIYSCGFDVRSGSCRNSVGPRLSHRESLRLKIPRSVLTGPGPESPFGSSSCCHGFQQFKIVICSRSLGSFGSAALLFFGLFGFWTAGGPPAAAHLSEPEGRGFQGQR